MKKYLLALLLLPCMCLAQKYENAYDAPYILKANITSLADPFTFPTVSLSLEKKLKNNFSISGEVGIQLYEFRVDDYDTSLVSPQGFKANVEVRYYDFLRLLRPSYKKDKKTRIKPYAGLNFFYRQNQYTTSAFYHKPNQDSLYTDCFSVNKKVGGVSVVIGIQKKLWNRLVFDVYGRVGLMYREAENHSREYNSDTGKLLTSIDMNASSMYLSTSLSENNGWLPSFNVGFRLGVVLGKKQKKSNDLFHRSSLPLILAKLSQEACYNGIHNMQRLQE